MRILGFINFTILDRLLWESNDHFLPMQTFYLDYMKEIWLSVHKPGIISGGAVTVNSGLTLDIAEALVLFSNEELVTVAAQQVSLIAADPADPRIDRLQYVHSIENNLVVVDVDGVNKQFDKHQRATSAALPGTPAGSPAIPVKTAGAISIAGISVAATQTVLTGADIDQKESVRDFSRPKDFSETSEVIDNNAAGGTFLPLLQADKTKYLLLKLRQPFQLKQRAQFQ